MTILLDPELTGVYIEMLRKFLKMHRISTDLYVGFMDRHGEIDQNLIHDSIYRIAQMCAFIMKRMLINEFELGIPAI